MLNLRLLARSLEALALHVLMNPLKYRRTLLHELGNDNLLSLPLPLLRLRKSQ